MKAAVFTIDAMLAFLLASATFAVIAQTLNYNSPGLEKQNIFSAANDLLAVMQNDGTLSSYASQSTAAIRADLAKKLLFLPQNFCGNLTISIYKYQSGGLVLGVERDFVLQKTSSAFRNCEAGKKTVKAKRVFYDSPSQQYGLAEFEVWLKERVEAPK